MKREHRCRLIASRLLGGLAGVVAAGVLVGPSVAAAQPTRPAPSRPPAATPNSAPASASKKAEKGEERKQPVTVDADRMERFGKEGLVIFTGNVVARQDNQIQYTDRMEVYLDEKGDRILRTVSKGSVRIITKDCKTGTAQRAEYFELQKHVKLIGDARVWDQENNVISGDTIDIFISEDRSVVLGGKQGRVKAQFFPKDDAQPAKTAATTPAAAPCVN